MNLCASALPSVTTIRHESRYPEGEPCERSKLARGTKDKEHANVVDGSGATDLPCPCDFRFSPLSDRVAASRRSSSTSDNGHGGGRSARRTPPMRRCSTSSISFRAYARVGQLGLSKLWTGLAYLRFTQACSGSENLAESIPNLTDDAQPGKVLLNVYFDERCQARFRIRHARRCARLTTPTSTRLNRFRI